MKRSQRCLTYLAFYSVSSLCLGAATAQAQITMETTTTYTQTMFNGGGTQQASAPVEVGRSCYVAPSGGGDYSDDDDDGGGGGGTTTGGGYVDTDGDGRGDTHISDYPGSYDGPTSSSPGGGMDGTSTKEPASALNGDEFYSYDGDHEGGSSGTSDDGGGSSCFITTAVARTTGEADDGPTLTAMRHLRDAYAQYTPQGKDRIILYYAVAPYLVSHINSRADAEKIWHDLHGTWIKPIKALVDRREYRAADKLYEQMVRQLVSDHMSDISGGHAYLSDIIALVKHIPAPANSNEQPRFILANIR